MSPHRAVSARPIGWAMPSMTGVALPRHQAAIAHPSYGGPVSTIWGGSADRGEGSARAEMGGLAPHVEGGLLPPNEVVAG